MSKARKYHKKPIINFSSSEDEETKKRRMEIPINTRSIQFPEGSNEIQNFNDEEGCPTKSYPAMHINRVTGSMYYTRYRTGSGSPKAGKKKSRPQKKTGKPF